MFEIIIDRGEIKPWHMLLEEWLAYRLTGKYTYTMIDNWKIKFMFELEEDLILFKLTWGQ